MEENMTQPSLFNHSLKWGVITGLTGIIITLLLYIIDLNLLIKWWLSLIVLLILLFLVVYGGMDYRKQLGGFISFGKAWQSAFLIFVIAGILSIIFRYLLFNVIDTDAKDFLVKASIDQGVAMMERFGADQSAIDQAMPRIQESAANTFTLGGMLKQFGFGLIFYAIFALISAAIVKKKEPEVM